MCLFDVIVHWIYESEDMNVVLKREDLKTESRTVISSGKRPNPSDLGS